MPWKPSTDFEEEVVNLQPHHDFIYGVLSEPQYSYPRPKSHTDYAANKKPENKEINKPNRDMNGKLHAIQQVQRIVNTKPLGEQPTVDDWENNKRIEQETIGMMRHFGMGVCVDQPLNQNVTIASYPVENKIKVVKNGRRKVTLFFDDNVFKLNEKQSDNTSSIFENCYNNESYGSKNNPNETLSSEIEDDSQTETSCNTSLFSTSSLSLNSFSNSGNSRNTFSSSPAQLQAQRSRQYGKLREDTSFLSLDSSRSSHKESFDSFATTEEMPVWKPIAEDDEMTVLHKQENWPALLTRNNFNNKNNNNDSINSPYSKEVSFNSYSTNDASSETTNSNNLAKRVNFLDRFIKPEYSETSNTSTSSKASTSFTSEPLTYANITKNRQSSPNHKKNTTADLKPFYTPRRMYALKRNTK